MPVNLQIGQSAIIGREGNIRITGNNSISKNHCRITRKAQDSYIIEDLGSTNGTFVDGIQVALQTVKPSTSIRLGSYETTLGKLLGIPIGGQAVSGGVNPPLNPGTGKEAYIDNLFKVYEQYDMAVRKIQKDRARMGINRMMLLTIPSLIGTVGSFIGTRPGSFPVAGVISAAFTLGICIYTFSMPGKSDNLVDEQFELSQNFQLNYCCPNCRNFLGQRHPKLLMQIGSCPMCKSTFRTRFKH